MSFPGDAVSHDARDPTPKPLQPLLAAVLEANSMWERRREVDDLDDYYEKVSVLWTEARAYFRVDTMDADAAGLSNAEQGEG